MTPRLRVVALGDGKLIRLKERKRKMAHMAPDPLRRAASVIAHATEAMDGRENAMHWLERENPSFGGRSPLQVLFQGDPDETQRMEDILTALDYGMHS